MDSTKWLLFAVVALISIMSPGPAVLLAISNSVRFGLRRVVYSSLGNVIGVFFVSGLAMAGLGALLKTSAFLFAALKLLGAGYLIYLGFRQWKSRTNLFAGAEQAQDQSKNQSQRSNQQLFFQGVTLALTNPKAILFFTALFPQFIDGTQALVPQFMILTATFMSISFCSLMFYGLLARSTRTWFSRSSHALWFNRVSGSMFVILGVGLLRLKNARN